MFGACLGVGNCVTGPSFYLGVKKPLVRRFAGCYLCGLAYICGMELALLVIFKPLLYIVLYVLVIFWILKWLFKVIPDGKIKTFLFKRRGGY